MPRLLTAASGRNVLTGIWFASFGLCLFLVFYLYLRDWIASDTLQKALQQLNAVYVTYIGVIATFYFGHRMTGPAAAHDEARIVLALAIATSVVWNVVIVAFILRPVLLLGPIEESLEQVGYFGPLLSWLVAPSVGFYFARPSGQPDTGD